MLVCRLTCLGPIESRQTRVAALLKFVEDSTGRTLVPDLTAVPGVGPWLTAWGNWLGLAVFLSLAAFVYSSAKKETVEG